jgi:hypothetical protein
MLQYQGMHTHMSRIPGQQKSANEDFFQRAHHTVQSVNTCSSSRKQEVTMMPVGVPRVPYRGPDKRWHWVDIWNCLYRERIVFLNATVGQQLGNELVATLLYLDSENKKDIQVYINCEGGEVVPCLALHDTFKHIKSDVATVAFGGAMGMAGFLLACGASPHVCEY